MKPGIYSNISEEEYHKSEGYSKSQLDHIINGSPMHYKYAKENTSPTTSAMSFGSLFHMITLEPERVADEVVTSKKFDKRKKGQKEAEQEFLEENKDKLIVSPDDMDLANYMADSIRNHTFANELLSASGNTEQSIYSIDEDTGLLKRGRIDKINDGGVLLDVKTCKDASPKGFKKSIYQYNYHVQESYYRNLYSEQTGEYSEVFYFIAVEKTPPYGVGVYNICYDMQVEGFEKWKNALNTLKRCMYNNSWSGYSDKAVTIV